MKKRQ